MGVGLYLKNYVDSKGRKAIQLKCRHKGRSFTRSVGISVNPSDWDSRALRIKNALPQVAKKLSQIKDDMFQNWEQYEAGSLTWEELTRRLSSGDEADSVLSFVRDVFSINRTTATTQSYIYALGAYKLILGLDEVTFKHFNYSHIQSAVNKWKEKGLSGSSIQSYINHIGSIVNEAHRRGLVSEPFVKHKTYRQRKVTKVIQTATPELFREAISKVKDIRDFQALSFWLLQFTLRGMYTSDLATMHLHTRENEEDWEGNRYVNHKRHKTSEPMTILYSCEPTEDILLALQNTIHITHKSRPSLLPDRTNPLQLMRYDYSDNRVHKNTWDVYAKRSSKLLLPMKSARKSFESYALMLNTSAEIRYRLLGHTDQSIKSHYQNWEWDKLSKQIDEAHLAVLESFEAKELFSELVSKLLEVTDEVTKNDLFTVHLISENVAI